MTKMIIKQQQDHHFTLTRICSRLQPRPPLARKSSQTVISENGYAFTPNSTATLHFIDPNGIHTTIFKNTDKYGNYIHSYQCHSDTAEGRWEYYAVDDSSGVRSGSVFLTITP